MLKDDGRTETMRQVVAEGRSYTWVPWGTAVVGAIVSAVGVFAGLAPWLYAAPPNEWVGDAVFSGPISGLLFWTGIACGPAAALVVSPGGVMVRNPLRHAWIPWGALEATESSFFGLRLDSSMFRVNVYACQTSNAARSAPSDRRPVARIGHALSAIKAEQLTRPPVLAPDRALPVKGVRPLLLICALAGTALQSAGMFAWAVHVSGR